MSKVLITGSAGAIGFYLASFFAKRNDQVFLVDNFIRSKRDDQYLNLLSKDGVSHLDGDLRDPVFVGMLPKDVDYVFHFAAFNGTQNFYETPFDVLEHCTTPTINLLRHYSDSKMLKRFVYAGSSEAYASTVTVFDWEVPTKEDVPLCISDPLNVRWSYGASKLHGEIACVAASKQFDIPFSIIRFHNVYGPRMGDKHVIPDFLERAKKGIYELYGFEDTRSFIFVEDAVIAAATVAESEACISQIVNVGGEHEITMLELGRMLMEAMGLDNKIICHPSPVGSVKRRAPDLTKLFELTNYSPIVSMEEGLRRTIEYYVSE